MGSKEERVAERNAMECKYIHELALAKEPHLLAIRNATLAIEQATKAYHDLIWNEADAIEQKHCFPGRIRVTRQNPRKSC